MESMGQPDRYEVMRVARLQYLSPNQDAVWSVNACWETWTEKFPSGRWFYPKDGSRKKSESLLKSVANVLFRNVLKRDSSAYDSEKKKKTHQRRDQRGWDIWELYVVYHHQWYHRRGRGCDWRRWDPCLSEYSWSDCTSSEAIAVGNIAFFWGSRSRQEWSRDLRGVGGRWWYCLLGVRRCRRSFYNQLAEICAFYQ